MQTSGGGRVPLGHSREGHKWSDGWCAPRGCASHLCCPVCTILHKCGQAAAAAAKFNRFPGLASLRPPRHKSCSATRKVLALPVAEHIFCSWPKNCLNNFTLPMRIYPEWRQRSMCIQCSQRLGLKVSIEKAPSVNAQSHGGKQKSCSA